MPWMTQEAQREYNKKYRESHKQEIRERMKQYRIKNREKLAQLNKQWRIENAEYVRVESKIRNRHWRHKNPERHKDNVNTRRLNTVLAVREYKQARGCSRCPEKDYRCLDFHHRNPEEKSFAISKGLSDKLALHTLMKEIEKCDLLCRNCHIKLNDRVYEVVE